MRLSAILSVFVLALGGAIGSAVGALSHGNSPSSSAQKGTSLHVGPGPVATTLRAHGYRLELRLTPNRPTAGGTVSLTLSRRGKPVNAARVRLTFTMLDMGMGSLSGLLQQTGPGRYGHTGPILGMSGHWGLRLKIVPLHGAVFTVNLIDSIGA